MQDTDLYQRPVAAFLFAVTDPISSLGPDVPERLGKLLELIEGGLELSDYRNPAIYRVMPASRVISVYLPHMSTEISSAIGRLKAQVPEGPLGWLRSFLHSQEATAAKHDLQVCTAALESLSSLLNNYTMRGSSLGLYLSAAKRYQELALGPWRTKLRVLAGLETGLEVDEDALIEEVLEEQGKLLQPLMLGSLSLCHQVQYSMEKARDISNSFALLNAVAWSLWAQGPNARNSASLDLARAVNMELDYWQAQVVNPFRSHVIEWLEVVYRYTGDLTPCGHPSRELVEEAVNNLLAIPRC